MTLPEIAAITSGATSAIENLTAHADGPNVPNSDGSTKVVRLGNGYNVIGTYPAADAQALSDDINTALKPIRDAIQAKAETAIKALLS